MDYLDSGAKDGETTWISPRTVRLRKLLRIGLPGWSQDCPPSFWRQLPVTAREPATTAVGQPPFLTRHRIRVSVVRTISRLRTVMFFKAALSSRSRNRPGSALECEIYRWAAQNAGRPAKRQRRKGLDVNSYDGKLEKPTYHRALRQIRRAEANGRPSSRTRDAWYGRSSSTLTAFATQAAECRPTRQAYQ